ncbi:flippase [Haladaptatus pallidirubidus]|uniref:flippase n=1 Tax=Haladaptatus pallidirubidus TaxID=1008152 RepID=UPI0035EE333F
MKGSGIVFVGMVIGRLLGLGAQVSIVRELSPTQFGHIALAYTIVSSIGGIAIFGVQDGVTRFLSASDLEETKARYVQSGFLIVAITGMISTFLIISTRYEIGAVMDDQKLPGLLAIFSFYTLIFPLSRVMISILRSRKESKSMILSRDIAGPILALSVFFVLAFFDYPIIGAIGYWISLPTFVLLFSFYYSIKYLPISSIINTPPQKTTIQKLWSFSWPLAISSSFVLFLSNLDVIMIGVFLNSESVGQYRAIQPLRQITLFVLSSVTFLYLPLATEHYENSDDSGLISLYRYSSKWISSITLPIVLVTGLYSDSVIINLFGRSYLPASSALTVLIFGYFLRVIVGPTGTTLKAINKSRVELISAMSGVIVNFIVNLLLIPKYGIIGAAIGTVLGYAVFNLVEILAIYNAIGGHPFTMNLIQPSVLSITSALITRSIIPDDSISIFALVGLIGFFGIVQVSSIFITNSLDKNDYMMINKIENNITVELKRLKQTYNER